ncbi:hypothetical protein [Tardiphaga robiniae]|uniref:Uncharacterized protein n=1 Tax=Tardiphaga robiniae TaxID=943830 RepID=A0A161SPY2_9BRAD|nr:hypothetical protein [Tardiphaga robiniae]KZD22932.1 hypothetical protein A4A58_05865 [Tardiphaga robiniae]
MVKKPKPFALEQIAQHGCADLLEVVLFAPQGANEHDFVLGADVRFGTMLLSSDDWSKSVEVGLARATLSLDFSGCEIDPAAHRLGDQKPSSVKTHVQLTQVKNKEAHVGAKTSFGATNRGGMVKPTGALSLGAGAALDNKVTTKETQVSDISELPVVSMSGNRWRFSAVAQAYMHSRYSGDEALCRIKIKTSPVSVEGRLSFQPKDICIVDVETPPAFLDRLRSSPNKTAIAKLLLLKHLREINPLTEKADAGVVIGCVSTLRGEIKSED